jgi:hypothetical protein
LYPDNIKDCEIKQCVIQYKIAYLIKQYPVLDRLKQALRSHPPPEARLSHPTVKFSVTNTDIPVDTPDLEEFDPEPQEEPIIDDMTIDYASYNYPVAPQVNYARIGPEAPSVDIQCHFTYRAFQEWLASAAIKENVQPHSTLVLHNDGGTNCFIFNTKSIF